MKLRDIQPASQPASQLVVKLIHPPWSSGVFEVQNLIQFICLASRRGIRELNVAELRLRHAAGEEARGQAVGRTPEPLARGAHDREGGWRNLHQERRHGRRLLRLRSELHEFLLQPPVLFSQCFTASLERLTVHFRLLQLDPMASNWDVINSNTYEYQCTCLEFRRSIWTNDFCKSPSWWGPTICTHMHD